MRFKVTCNWTDDVSIYNRFKRNYITTENYDNRVEITLNDDYDYLIVFNRNVYNQNIKCPKENVIGFIMEPSWTNSWDKNIATYCNKVYFHDVWLLDKDTLNIERFISHPAMMLYHMDQDPIDRYLKSAFKKSKRMSFIVSNGNSQPNEHILYYKRNDLARKILNSNLLIDIYGNGWEREVNNDNRIKGRLNNKADGLIDYEYSIAIENCCEKNYLTEKYFDCILCDVVPVYYGAPNVDEIYPFKGHIDLQLNSDNVLQQLDDIIKNDNYEKRLDSLIKSKLSYHKKYNIYELLKEFI